VVLGSHARNEAAPHRTGNIPLSIPVWLDMNTQYLDHARSAISPLTAIMNDAEFDTRIDELAAFCFAEELTSEEEAHADSLAALIEAYERRMRLAY
jgi:hypothetical protein